MFFFFNELYEHYFCISVVSLISVFCVAPRYCLLKENDNNYKQVCKPHQCVLCRTQTYPQHLNVLQT